MTEIRFHSWNPRQRPRAWKIDARAGRVVAATCAAAAREWEIETDSPDPWRR